MTLPTTLSDTNHLLTFDNAARHQMLQVSLASSVEDIVHHLLIRLKTHPCLENHSLHWFMTLQLHDLLQRVIKTTMLAKEYLNSNMYSRIKTSKKWTSQSFCWSTRQMQ